MIAAVFFGFDSYEKSEDPNLSWHPLLPSPTFNWQIFSHHCAILCLTIQISSADSWTPLFWLHLQNICSCGFQVLVRRKYNLRGPGLKVCFRYFRDLFGIPPDDFMVRRDLILLKKNLSFFLQKKQQPRTSFGHLREFIFCLHLDFNLQRESEGAKQPGRQRFNILLDQGWWVHFENGEIHPRLEIITHCINNHSINITPCVNIHSIILSTWYSSQVSMKEAEFLQKLMPGSLSRLPHSIIFYWLFQDITWTFNKIREHFCPSSLGCSPTRWDTIMPSIVLRSNTKLLFITNSRMMQLSTWCYFRFLAKCNYLFG